MRLVFNFLEQWSYKYYNFCNILLIIFVLVVAIVFAILQTELKNSYNNEYFHHSVGHSAVAIILLIIITFFTEVVTYLFAKKHKIDIAAPLAGAFSAISFYASREIRDYNKGTMPIFKTRTRAQYCLDFEDSWNMTIPSSQIEWSPMTEYISHHPATRFLYLFPH